VLAQRFHVSRKGGTGEVDGVTHRVTCTWWLLRKRLEAKIEVISYFRLDVLEEFISQTLQVFCSLHDFS